jgi:putative endonuclease
MRQAYVYIMSNKSHRLYVGSTTNLPRRVAEHKMKRFPSGFTARYNFDRLVWFEVVADLACASEQERKIKRWLRRRKVALIQESNPNWLDLSLQWSELLMVQ